MQYDLKYKIRTWNHVSMLHWILNPGLAVNELLLGQRVPKVFLIDQTTARPLYERSFVPCPHCGTIHDARLWSVQNHTAFRNWFGLYCNACGGVIPCLRNWFSGLVLILTAPLWYWFRNAAKRKWLANQPARYRDLRIEKTLPNPFARKGWVLHGLGWGASMLVMINLIVPYLLDEAITLKGFMLGVVIWSLAGLGWGYFMKWYVSRQVRPAVSAP